jgi:dCMP deaminase
VHEASSAKWDRRFLRLAREIASWSKDPSTQVGAIIVDALRIPVALGYNGLPRGIADTQERLTDRSLKYSLIIHAELNALHNAGRSVRGCTLYTWPLMPCSSCAGHLIQAGIARVVAPIARDDLHRRWADSLHVARELLLEAGVELTEVSSP